MNELQLAMRDLRLRERRYRQLYRLTHKRKYHRTKKKLHVNMPVRIKYDRRFNKVAENQILDLLVKHPLWGARKIHKALTNKGYIISLSTVHRRIRQYGLQRTRRNDLMQLRKTFARHKGITVPELLKRYFKND